MDKTGATQFISQKYMSLESYRKDGRAVAIPVWFAEEDGTFYLYSLANAWKVKRIRNNRQVRIAPCNFRGDLKGQWVAAEAHIGDAREEEQGHRLLTRKYGIWKRVGDFFSRLRKRERVVIVIRLTATERPTERRTEQLTAR